MSGGVVCNALALCTNPRVLVWSSIYRRRTFRISSFGKYLLSRRVSRTIIMARSDRPSGCRWPAIRRVALQSRAPPPPGIGSAPMRRARQDTIVANAVAGLEIAATPMVVSGPLREISRTTSFIPPQQIVGQHLVERGHSIEGRRRPLSRAVWRSPMPASAPSASPTAHGPRSAQSPIGLARCRFTCDNTCSWDLRNTAIRLFAAGVALAVPRRPGPRRRC
jgi:hypothetical protein